MWSTFRFVKHHIASCLMDQDSSRTPLPLQGGCGTKGTHKNRCAYLDVYGRCGFVAETEAKKKHHFSTWCHCEGLSSQQTHDTASPASDKASILPMLKRACSEIWENFDSMSSSQRLEIARTIMNFQKKIRIDQQTRGAGQVRCPEMNDLGITLSLSQAIELAINQASEPAILPINSRFGRFFGWIFCLVSLFCLFFAKTLVLRNVDSMWRTALRVL